MFIEEAMVMNSVYSFSEGLTYEQGEHCHTSGLEAEAKALGAVDVDGAILVWHNRK